MSSRSWMAALAFGAFGLASGTTQALAGDAPTVNTVNLELRIAGLGQEGCEIEIKPANAGCKFEPIRRRVDRGVVGGISKLPTIAIAAESLRSDRLCAFAITIKEPNQEPKTFPWHVRLQAPSAEKPTPVLASTCYLTTPSLAAKDAPEASRRKR